MKSTATPKTNPPPGPFPKLMISNGGIIILAESLTQVNELVGVEVYPRPGVRRENWVVERFEDFYGTVTLEN